MPSDQDRFQRQEDLVPRQRLAEIKATVIGVAAMAARPPCSLPASACRACRLVDFDVVDLSNVTTQGYLAADVGSQR